MTSVAIVGGSTAGQGTATTAATSSTTSASHHDSGSSTTAPPGTIAGGTIGGVAGLAVLLLVALIFLRWYKRRSQQGHQALPPSDTMSPDPDHPPSTRSGPGMAERAGLMPLAAAVPALFRHQNRSTDSAPPSSSGGGGERGFTRVSGRKLPSAFSEGMSTNDPYPPPMPNMPLTGSGSSYPERNLSSTSFYRDSQGFYGDEGPSPAEMSTSPTNQSGETPPGEYGEMMLSPGPQRRPTVHAGGPYMMSPGSTVPSTPVVGSSGVGQAAPLMGGAARSPELGAARSETPTSMQDNRSSRFTEEV